MFVGFMVICCHNPIADSLSVHVTIKNDIFFFKPTIYKEIITL